MKRSMALLGITVMLVAMLGWWTRSASAVTMKCRTAGIQRMREAVPVGDMEGHGIGISNRVGMAFCDGEELANFTVQAVFNTIAGKGGEALGYVLWNFVDGSIILTKFQQTHMPPSDPSFDLDSRGMGEILSGSGRFAGSPAPWS